jgi:hypothetical protein
VTKYLLHVDINDTFFEASDIDRYSNNNTALKTVIETTKTGRHDIAEILLKVAIKHQKSNQIKSLKDKYYVQNCFSISFTSW